MPKAPRKQASDRTAPFPFVRQFTAPPFFVDIEDAKRKSELLLDAVHHSGSQGRDARGQRKPAKKQPAKKARQVQRRRKTGE